MSRRKPLALTPQQYIVIADAYRSCKDNKQPWKFMTAILAAHPDLVALGEMKNVQWKDFMRNHAAAMISCGVLTFDEVSDRKPCIHRVLSLSVLSSKTSAD